MARINSAQKTQSGGALSSLLGLGGAVVGGIYGGIPGAAAGGSLGQAAGGMITPNEELGPQQIENGQSGAMARRSEDPAKALKEAEAALPELPEKIRQQYAPIINEANYIAKRKGAY